MDQNNSQYKFWNKPMVPLNLQTSNISYSTQSISMQQPPTIFSSQPNDLRTQNEKLQVRIRYLEEFIQNFQDFDKSLNLIDLKGFLAKNYKRFCMLLEEIYDLKGYLELEKSKNQNLLIELTNIKMSPNLEVQKQIQHLQMTITKQNEQIQFLQQNNNQNHDFSPLTNNQLKEQIQNLQNTVKQLSVEIEELSTKNIKQRDQLMKKDFFKEYDYMCKEVDGLRKQNQQLEDKLKQKEKETTPKLGVQKPHSEVKEKQPFSLFK